MRIALLGPVELSQDGQRIRLNGSKQLALLALLALNTDRLLSADHIVDALWADDEPSDPINALQHQISRLRAAVGGEGELPRIWLFAADTSRCCGHQAVRASCYGGTYWASVGGQPGGRDHSRSALNLWRGPPLDGLPSYPWVLAESARLENLRLDVIEDRLEAELALGLQAELLPELEALVGNLSLPGTTLGSPHPGALSVWQAGRRLGVLSGSCPGSRGRSWVGPGFGVAATSSRDPGPRSIIVRRIRETATVTLAAAPLSPTGNLPAPLTSFIGRQDQLIEVGRAVRECRLVTLAGPPGVGKTRLAVARPHGPGGFPGRSLVGGVGCARRRRRRDLG